MLDPAPKTMETLQKLDMPAGVYIDVQMKSDTDNGKATRKQLVTTGSRKPAAKRPAAKKPVSKKTPGEGAKPASE